MIIKKQITEKLTYLILKF